MLGMGFIPFLTLSAIAAVVAAAYHWGLRYRFAEGPDAVFGSLLVGWVGAWLGSPVVGHWLWSFQGVYIVPAILGAIFTIHLRTLTLKTLARLLSMRPATEIPEPAHSKTSTAA